MEESIAGIEWRMPADKALTPGREYVWTVEAARASSFVLVPGNNEIAINYLKTDPTGNDKLEITLENAGYLQPQLRLVSNTTASDRLAVSVPIAKKPPANFKAVILEYN